MDLGIFRLWFASVINFFRGFSTCFCGDDDNNEFDYQEQEENILIRRVYFLLLKLLFVLACRLLSFSGFILLLIFEKLFDFCFNNGSYISPLYFKAKNLWVQCKIKKKNSDYSQPFNFKRMWCECEWHDLQKCYSHSPRKKNVSDNKGAFPSIIYFQRAILNKCRQRIHKTFITTWS